MQQSLQESAGGVILVITRKVLQGKEPAYDDWLRRISEAERSVAGFLGREDILPLADGQDWHTTVLRFESKESLDAWTHSPTYKGLIEEVEPLCCHVAKSRVEPGFYGWFPDSDKGGHPGPPTWKMTMAVTLALYPSIFLISWLFTSHVDWDFPVKLLVSNIIAVSCVSWISMPLVRRLLGTWLAPSSNCSARKNILGSAGIAGLLLLLLIVFQQVPLG